MKNFKTILLFSLVVTLAMNAFDMYFHYSAGTAVHLNYVTIKLTIIFLTTYLISQFIGINIRDGLVTTFAGPFFFWLYYLFAYPSLDREVFWIDEQFYFMFFHSAMMFVAYFASYWTMMKADSTLRKIAFLIASTFSLLALEILYFMVSIKLLGFSEEEEVKMITFADASTMLAIVGIPICIVVWLKIPERLKGLLAASLVGIGAYFWLSPPLINTGITHAFYAFVMVNIIFALIQVYEKPLHK